MSGRLPLSSASLRPVRQTWRGKKAAARQEGIPLTAQELQQPLPPASQNAAPLYTKLTHLLHDKPLGLPPYAEGMDAFHAYTPAQVAAVRHTLAARQDVMTLVHQAADKPQCVFLRDWKQGVTLNFPEFMPMREAARLIKTESYLLARGWALQRSRCRSSQRLSSGSTRRVRPCSFGVPRWIGKRVAYSQWNAEHPRPSRAERRCGQRGAKSCGAYACCPVTPRCNGRGNRV